MSEIKEEEESIKSNKRSDFFKCTFSNDWIHSSYCSNCDLMFFLDILDFDVYEVKRGHCISFYCQKCYLEIQRAHAKRNIDWKGELFWSCLENADLQ
jgi:hypothetical protein